MNVRCVNSTDKTNFKAGFIWTANIPQKYADKLSDVCDEFAQSTARGSYCLFIDKVSEKGDIYDAFLGDAKQKPLGKGINGAVINLISQSDFPPLNVNAKDFLPKIIERFNGMLVGTNALQKDPKHLEQLTRLN